MKKVIKLMLLVTITASAWEINTHRAIDRLAIEKSENLKSFVKNSDIPINSYFYNNEQFEGYGMSYIQYIEDDKKGEGNGVAQWGQKFDSKPSYQKMIEAGTILEDAQYPGALHRSYGRFNNHFYDAQNDGHKLTMTPYPNVNALKWATGDTYHTETKFNYYSYPKALNYFKLGFTEKDPKVRKKYQAEMLVSVGHLMHMVNDMSVPAHVRDDAHPFDDPLEKWARGGEEGGDNIGFRVSGNTVKDYSKLLDRNANKMVKYNNFDDFMAREAKWTATNFFSKDTILSKLSPSASSTYEDFESSKNEVEKYYIRSYGNGKYDCDNGCVPYGTKLGIRIKSYIINALREKYYNKNTPSMLGKSTSFKGDYSVVEDNARILIPRAIANARNFVNYFFRGKVSASITNHEIVVKNISNAALVNNKATATFHPGAVYRFIYKGDDGRWYPFVFQYDASKHDGSIAFTGDIEGKYLMSGVTSRIYVKPGESITIPIILDYDTTTLIYGKTIMLVYDGDIGVERGLAVCSANNLTGGIFTTED
jgi:hypothetical protein